MSQEVGPLQRPTFRSALDLIATIMVIVIGGVVLWRTFGPASRPPTVPEIQIPATPVAMDGAPIKGNAAATLVIVEFSDFQCPFCRRFAQNELPGIVKDYVDSGRVRLAFRNLPLSSIHPYAEKAAEASVCAARSGKFWELHDKLFTGPAELAEPNLFAIAENTGLGTADFKTCMTAVARERVALDLRQAEALGIRTTPSFLFGSLDQTGRLVVRRTLTGARSHADFAKILDALLVGGTR